MPCKAVEGLAGCVRGNAERSHGYEATFDLLLQLMQVGDDEVTIAALDSIRMHWKKNCRLLDVPRS